MRQGPDYSQHIDQDSWGEISLRIPLELSDEWYKYRYVIWHDNKDGTITLTPYNELIRGK